MAKRKISGIINATEHPMNLETPWNQKQPDGTYHAYAGDDIEAFLKKELSNRTPTEELVSGETKPPTSGTVFDAMVGTVTDVDVQDSEDGTQYVMTVKQKNNQGGESSKEVRFSKYTDDDKVVDQNAGLDVDISVRCFGEYSYRITNPILFYTNLCGNVEQEYTRSEIDGQLKTELLTALQPAFARISDMGIRYSAVPAHTLELADALNDVLSAKWRDLRGIEIVSLGVSSIKASEEDEQMIKEMQRNAAFRDPTRAAAHLVGAQASAMQAAAANEGGATMGFMGMGMAGAAGGMNPQALFQMGQQQAAQPVQSAPAQPAPAAPAAPAQPAAPAGDSWTCACGNVATGKFCPECGAKKPEPPKASAEGAWTCPTCGASNKGKFCAECGTKKPAGVPQYKCDKCGWEPADPTKPPKFCPECGDPFDDGDIV